MTTQVWYGEVFSTQSTQLESMIISLKLSFPYYLLHSFSMASLE